MNEIDILNLFYDEMKAKGISHDALFKSMDETAVELLREKLKTDVQLEDVHKYTDICLANEWLERTTADPGYLYLSLTRAGLSIAIANQYS